MNGLGSFWGWVSLAGLAVATVTACGSDDPGTQGIDPAAAEATVSFIRHDNPTYLIADKEFFAAYMSAHPGVKVADVSVDFRALATALNTELKADRFSYDLVLVPPGRVCSYADNVTDVPDDVVTLAQAQQLFFAAPLEGSICGGRLKGLPVEYNLEYGGVVVNLEKYQARFPGKPPGWSDWQSFIAEAAALTEYDASGRPAANGLDIDPGWSPPTRHMLFAQILQRKGRYLSASGDNTLDLQTPEARDSLTAMVDWVNRDKVMFTSLVPVNNTSVAKRLAAGATGYGWGDPGKPLSCMGYMGTWGVPATKSLVPAGKTGRYEFFALPPMVGTEHRFVTDSGWSFVVPRTSKNQKLAWDVARSLALSPEASRKWAAITGSLPALRSNGSPAAAALDPVLARVQPLLEHGHWRGYVPAEALDDANATIVGGFFAVVRGSKTIDQALKEMQDAANAAIAKFH